jgi:hypothetical protein
MLHLAQPCRAALVVPAAAKEVLLLTKAYINASDLPCMMTPHDAALLRVV